MALKRLMTAAAALAIVGCSGSEDGVFRTPPPYAGNLRGSDAVDSADPSEQAPATVVPEPAPEGEPSGSRSEEQGSEELSFDGSEQPAAGGGEAASEVAAGEEPAPSTEEPVAEEPAASEQEPPPVVEEPVIPEEPEIVRPALNCGAPPPQLLGGVEACQVEDQGNVAGQDWFLWYNGNGGGCMTAYDNLAGAFSAQWNNPGDFLARIGYWFDETQTFEQIGEIGADYSFTKQGSAGGFNYIGIYGWTVGTVVEYYIVEDDFIQGGPVQPFNTQMRGSFQVDGAQYNIYSGTRVNAPSIVGTSTFTQVFSVRQNPRQCGHVSISEHFRQWQRVGVNMGMAKEAKILVEAGGGNGSVTFTHANVTITPPN